MTMKPLKTILLHAAPRVMENFSSSLGRKIKVTARSHRGTTRPWKNIPGNVNHDTSAAAHSIGYVSGDHVVKDDGLYFPYTFTDADALRIFEANMHRGWSIGIKPTSVSPDGEVLAYIPHHFSLILPGQKPVAPKSIVDRVDSFSQSESGEFAGFSIVEIDTMEQPTDAPPADPAQAQTPPAPPEADASAPAAAPSATADPITSDEETPVAAPAPPAETPADPPAVVPAAPAAPVPIPSPAPTIAGFSEVDIFAMRDDLKSLKQAREKELAELEELRQYKTKTEQAERDRLLSQLRSRSYAGIDFASESLDNLRKFAAIAQPPSGFSEFSGVPPGDVPPEPAASGAGARDHNREPSPLDTKAQKQLALLKQIWG